MAGTELVVRRGGEVDLRELRAQASLRDIRLKGHAYVELRRDGKRTIFFCVLCLAPLYSDSVVFDHLKGKFHARRYAAAKATLFGPVPWPFSDGVLFFSGCSEKEQNLGGCGYQNGELCNCNGNGYHNANGNGNRYHSANGSGKGNANVSGLRIPGVLVKEKVTDLKAQFIGLGQVGARIYDSSENLSKISKIWCAWLGKGGSEANSELVALPKSDFAVITFPYTYDLGRKGDPDEENSPPSASSFFEVDDSGHRKKKRKKSFSDPEDYFEGSKSRSGSSGSSGSSGKDSPDMSSHSANGHQLQRNLSDKTDRRELRRQKRLAAERTCGICCQAMLSEKDVATLLNCKTGKLACSSRNTNGAFHIFHASCLIHWILFREFHAHTNQSTNIKTTTRGRKAKLPRKSHAASLFCPECQGSGMPIEGDELEKPTVSLSEMFRYKLKAIEAQKEWMKNPEILQKCSTGLHFPFDFTEKLQEKVADLKLLHFYRADA